MPGALGVFQTNMNNIGEFLDLYSFNTITAFAGGGQTGATPLFGQTNRVTTVATAGDSVRLPVSSVGRTVTVINKGALSMQVYGAGTDTVNAIATATGVAQGPNSSITYTCVTAGAWETPLAGTSAAAIAVIAASGAIYPKQSQTYVFTKAGVAAMTLAAPVVTTDDGVTLEFTSDTANAHTITATGLLDTGTATVNLATFAAFKGASIQLMAYNGRWKVLNLNAVVLS